MEFYKKALIGISSLLAILLIFKKGKKMDSKTEAKINTLHPKIRDKARQLIIKAKNEGIDLIITSGFRTYAEQNELYKQGRTKKGGIVTNAKGGQSNHNFGLAFDVVPVVNGKLDWYSKDWKKIAVIGKSLGFKWGGDWTSIKDFPHFEMMFGNTLAQLRNKIKTGNTTENNYAMV
jgi:peptidoglycan L-alanyl-D-glutamate endopeptidase CwlK